MAVMITTHKLLKNESKKHIKQLELIYTDHKYGGFPNFCLQCILKLLFLSFNHKFHHQCRPTYFYFATLYESIDSNVKN